MGAISPDSVKQFSFFSNWSYEETEVFLASGKAISFSKGNKLTEEGKSGDSFYLILEGSVSLSHTARDQEKEFATLQVGDMIGEASFFQNTPQKATGTATEKVSTLCFSKEDFAQYRKLSTNQASLFFESLFLMVLKRFSSLSDQTDSVAFWF